MDKIILKNGKIINAEIGEMKIQDYIEIRLKTGETVIVTATSGGKLKIGNVGNKNQKSV